MPTETIIIAVVAFSILLALIFAELPIWIALASSGGVGLLMLSGGKITFSALGAEPFTSTSSFVLLVIPMFVLMGVIASRAGMAGDLFAVAEKLSRKVPGGLGVATILACGGFGAVTGSSVATVTTIGKIAITEMSKRGYRANAAAALVAIGATLGVLIPPSILMVVFAVLTEQSVARLLIAGIVPGVVSMIGYSTIVVVYYKKGFFNPRTEGERELVEVFTGAIKVAAGDDASTVSTKARTKTRNPKAEKLELRNYTGTFYALLLFTIVIGGMYSGLFTSTEAGAVAAVAALVIMILRLSRTGVKNVFTQVKESLFETASVNTMIFALVFGGGIFAFFLIKSAIPSHIARAIVATGFHPMIIVLISLVMLIVLGMFLDELSILLIVIPLIWPVIREMGVDGIWYGILVMKATTIGLVTPPVGINVYVAAGLSKHVSAEEIFKAVGPFFLAELGVITTLILFPTLSTFLPSLL